ncbi:hypothetical protein ACPOM7_00180 [Peribacillus castrilensis]|nr:MULTISPECIES: hypothetical protein [Bacillaceae]MCF7623392.1 hypothetical protein [Peribacillus frigoritolerans]
MKMIVNLYIYLFVAFILGSCQSPDWNMDESNRGKKVSLRILTIRGF